MKTHKIEISEDALRILRATCLFTLSRHSSLTENEQQEIDHLASRIFDLIEDTNYNSKEMN